MQLQYFEDCRFNLYFQTKKYIIRKQVEKNFHFQLFDLITIKHYKTYSSQFG